MQFYSREQKWMFPKYCRKRTEEHFVASNKQLASTPLNKDSVRRKIKALGTAFLNVLTDK